MSRPIRHRGKWRIRWQDAAGKRHSEVYDDHEEAVLQLRRHEGDAAEILTGFRPRPPPDKSFDELADYWLTHRTPRKRSPKDDRHIIGKHLRPEFTGTAVRAITSERIDDYALKLQERVPPLATNTMRNILSKLRAMLSLARRHRWIVERPHVDMPKEDIGDEDIRYLRNKDELDRFIRAAKAAGDRVFTLYCGAVYTGMRQGELACLRWSDVDLDRRTITVQRSFNGPTKTSRVRYVPILDPLLPILRAWRARTPGELVFPNRRGRTYSPSARVFEDTLWKVLGRAGLPNDYLTFHGLRHTFASHWVMNGGDLYRLQKILGHSDPSMTQIYAHLAPAAFVGDFGRLGTEAPRVESAAVLKMSALEDPDGKKVGRVRP
jgi:integrase